MYCFPAAEIFNELFKHSSDSLASRLAGLPVESRLTLHNFFPFAGGNTCVLVLVVDGEDR